MKSMQKGFTLIELMIVVAIIAILAAIAIPAYQDYITKSQFTESQTVADGLKTPIQEFFNQNGACPAMNATDGLATDPTSYAGKYVAKVQVGTGKTSPTLCPITVTFKSATVATQLQGKTVVFNGDDKGGTFVWHCVPDTSIAQKYLPTACKN
jgi:type IV pilus assembly protein PilA